MNADGSAPVNPTNDKGRDQLAGLTPGAKLLVGLSVVLILSACGGGGGGGGGDESVTGPQDDGTDVPTETTPADNDPPTDEPADMSVPGFTGDPVSGSASAPAVMALAFAPHAKVTTLSTPTTSTSSPMASPDTR